MMHMAEFARAARIAPDTVRFYVRRGLLHPEVGAKGGRNPYRLFTADHVRDVELIRLGQALGMPLKEIAPLLDDAREGRMSPERATAMATEQRDRLRRRSAELSALADYLDAKLVWMEGGSQDGEPRFADYMLRDDGRR